MKLILKLAWRNIWRNGRRSVITILAVTFATLLTISMRGMQLGTYQYNIQTTLNMFSGYMQVQRKEFQENQTLTKSIKVTPGLTEKIKDTKGVVAFTPRIIASGLIGKNKGNSQGAAIIGIDPATEKKVTTIYKRVKDGKFISNDNIYDVVVGYKMLKNLDVKVGDEIVILAGGFDGSMGNLKFRIAGTIRMGQTELDVMTVIMNIKAAKELLSMNGRVSYYAIKLTGLDVMKKAQQELNKKLAGTDLTALNWEQLNPEMKQSIELDDISGVIFLALLIIVVAFGILNTVIMSVTERYREFGIMLALGTKNILLTVIIFFETMILTFMGIIAGAILGWGVNFYIVKNPITFTGNIGQLYEELGWRPELHSTVSPDIFIASIIPILIIAVLVCIYMAFKMYHLEALKGIRYT